MDKYMSVWIDCMYAENIRQRQSCMRKFISSTQFSSSIDTVSAVVIILKDTVLFIVGGKTVLGRVEHLQGREDLGSARVDTVLRHHHNLQ